MLHVPKNSGGVAQRGSIAHSGPSLHNQRNTARADIVKTAGLRNGLRGQKLLANVASPTQHPTVELAIYDNRLNVSFSSSGTWGPKPLLFRSAERLGVPYTIGALDKDGGVGAAGPRKAWEMGDRDSWLEQGVMKRSTASLVFHVDGTDTLLLSSADEIARKYADLTREGEELVISADAMLWPEDMQWDGRYVCARQRETFASCTLGMGCCRTREYPSAGLPSRAALLRWANIGAVLGPPRSWLRLFQCMRELYPKYPRACPIGRHANGSYELVDNTPFRTRGRGVYRNAWGWDQACYHMYLMEQHHGLLPRHCPRLKLDFVGAITLPLGKISKYMVLGKNKRVLYTPTQQTPCMVHAVGASKYVYISLQWWWDRPDDKLPRPQDWEQVLSQYRGVWGYAIPTAEHYFKMFARNTSAYKFIEPRF